MLQALYFCRPFREGLLEYYERLPETHEENLLTCLGELFFEIASQNKRTGVYSPASAPEASASQVARRRCSSGATAATPSAPTFMFREFRAMF